MLKHVRFTLDGNAYVDFEEDGHIVKTEKLVVEKHAKIVICNDGVIRCSCCTKPISYPIICFSDIDYCPRCGAKISKRGEGYQTVVCKVEENKDDN